ncbi:hypothetical protein CVT24_004542 [Panaeolus cyanescens]|uniref:Uncharacterized protein n=1 Tax=Panaeolus cyanescens TaxID=181874 RepID=A0A409W1I5_9AGAR|nr:hypothetical protein CVT24_004542 [Panaeolus cyanescens]
MVKSIFGPLFLVLVHQAVVASAQTWCGKHYKAGSAVVAPGGNFPQPATISSGSLLAFRCAPAIRPYLPEDATSTTGDVAIIVDTPITQKQISNASPITLSSTTNPGNIDVSISINGKVVATGAVPLNTTKHTLPFSLSSLTPRTQPYTISCTATHGSQKFTATGSLSYLPTPPSTIGSVTKMDLRTGFLLARPATGKGGPYAPVFPIGYYTQFDTYLAKDFTVPATLKSLGYNVIHPVPTLTNLTALDIVLDKMQAAGVYLMYDMRGTYMNATSVTEQVNRIKSRPNLLLWYTADEPDGTSDPLDATVKSSNLITSLDGGDGKGGAGYHPVSLVLNCQDYYFNEYSSGADILLQDAYPVGINATFSTVWKAPCTPDFGDCGCDNCIGQFEDISTRMDEFRDRLFVNGWDRTKAVWTVPQGFGPESYWPRPPTGLEFVVESILGINHGALGSVSWDDPTTADIKSSGSLLALAIPKIVPFLSNPATTFRQVTVSRVDFGLWSLNGQTLILGTNMNYSTQVIRILDLGLAIPPEGAITTILNVGSSAVDPARGHFIFPSVASGGFIVQTA